MDNRVNPVSGAGTAVEPPGSKPGGPKLRFALAGAATVVVVAWGLGMLDAGLYDGLPLFPWESFDTAYSAGYYEAGFRAIRLGMEEERVKCILGLPLSEKTTAASETYWYYSRPAGDGSYLVRNVILRDHRVVRVFHAREYD